MPTYEYRCNACKREFEYQQRMADDDLVKCEVCGEDKLEKLISWSAFQLKGSGWYKDLYSSAPADKIAAMADRGVPPKTSDKEASPAAADTAKPASGGDAAASTSPAPSSGTASATTGAGSSSGSGSTGSSGSGSASKE
ncbi:MAG: zinc ribbon domain-containing protein [Myxococcales bacterium]|nr:zinc ribbon domain-containing protein [Myxococcales bacterium]